MYISNMFYKTNTGLRRLLARPKKALTLAQMDAGVASHLKAKHAAKRTYAAKQKP